MITQALRNKFKNVPMHSPIGSPACGSPGFNSPAAFDAIESPAAMDVSYQSSSCSTPYTEPQFFEPIIHAVPYQGTPESTVPMANVLSINDRYSACHKS